MEDEDKNSKSIGSNTVWVRPPPSALKSSLKSKDFWLLFFLTHFFSYFCVLGENADDGIGRGHFAGEIQMCINVACCADVAVPQPLLNFLQAHPVGIKQTGAGRGNGYASSGVLPENLGNAGSGNRAESAFPLYKVWPCTRIRAGNTSTHSTVVNFKNTESFNPCPERATVTTTALNSEKHP